MKYKDILNSYKKELKDLLDEKNKEFLEKYDLYEEKPADDSKDPWDKKRVYEQITNDEMNELVLLEKKINALKIPKENSAEKSSNVVANVLFALGGIIAFSGFVYSMDFFEYAPEVGFTFLFSGILSGSLLFAIATIIKMLILISKKLTDNSK
jgi:hypothetical protein